MNKKLRLPIIALALIIFISLAINVIDGIITIGSCGLVYYIIRETSK